MAFTPEDGNGVTGANSFVTVADADSYFATHRSASVWSAKTTTEKQIALMEATAYIENAYRGSWIGTIASTEQGLAWPRTNAYDADHRELTGVPQQLVAAACEMALVTFDGGLNTTLDGDTRVKRRKVGPIETEFDTDAPRGRSYSFLPRMLSGLTSRQAGGISLARC